jgi:hypothetical protein
MILFPFGPPLASPAKRPGNPWAGGPFAMGKTGEGLALAATAGMGSFRRAGGTGWWGIRSESMLGSRGFDFEGRGGERLTRKGDSAVA